MGFALLVDGIYEPDSIKFIQQHLPENGIFIDIGANIGVFSINIAQCLSINGKVIAIEASPNIFSYLQENISLNSLTNIKPLQLAVTNRDEAAVAFYEAPNEKFGMGSLGAQFSNPPIKVRTKTLDSILKDEKIERISLIKIDIEGYELIVIFLIVV